MPGATGHAEAMGHHGELVQGVFEDTGGHLKRALVSLPCPDLRSKASFQPDDSNRVITFQPDRHKALRAAKLTVAAFGPEGMGGALSVESNIPIGRGMGSSTADVLASILAVADCLQITLAAEDLPLDPFGERFFWQERIIVGLL